MEESCTNSEEKDGRLLPKMGILTCSSARLDFFLSNIGQMLLQHGITVTLQITHITSKMGHPVMEAHTAATTSI